MRCPDHKNRFASTCLALLFACGVVLYPAWHRAHCAGSAATTVESGDALGFETARVPAGPTGHHADDCPVCHLFNAPITSVSEPLLTAQPCGFSEVVTPVLAAALPRVCHLLPYSCGPPA